MRWLVAILALLVVLSLIGYFRIEGGVMSPGQTVLDSTLLWVKNATGSAIAAIAALLLLLRAIQNERVETIVPPVAALLAGLALVRPDWPTTLGLAAVATGLLLREAVAGRAPREDQELD